ncbi:MAG: tripartite tricarboxylate transporter substrate binding protein [Rhodoferax sp.]|nr:tripartite tricarboxylate transporter substrate binding protein [Rhodoferax sp.]
MNLLTAFARTAAHTQLLFAGLLLALPLTGHAQYPDQPIKVIVAFPAGSAVDVVARSLISRLAAPLGQPVVIENKVGASGNIGFELVARAPKDGYTLLFAPTQLAANPGLGKVNYDPLKDFAPIMLTSRISALLVVPPESPAKTVADLIAMAKAKPGALSYASGGNGGIGHFSGELIKANGGNLDIVHIPYKSAAEQVQSVMANQTAFAYPAMQLALQQVKAGKLRALAVTGANRSALLPMVPTMSEAMNPGFVLDAWYGLLAPAGTPPEVVNKLHAELARILRDPAARAPLVDGSHEIVASTPAEFAATIQKDFRVWGDLARKLDVKVD